MPRHLGSIVATSAAVLGIGAIGVMYGYDQHQTRAAANAQGNVNIMQKSVAESGHHIIAGAKRVAPVTGADANKPKQTPLNMQHVQEHWKDFNGRKVIDWNQPTGDHPDLNGIATKDLRIVVDQSAPQRMRIYKNNDLLTQFIVSTGKGGDKKTPDGNYTIQPEHGDWFYNPEKGIESGAHNWVSWKDHGVYLFHSITYQKDGKTLRLDRQGNLGKPNSDGCVQMSIPDSQWFYQNFKDRVGTRIEIINGNQVK